MKAPAPELTSFEARRQRVEHLRMRSSVLAIPTHPSFAHHNAKKRCFLQKGKRSAERRIVLPMSAPQTSLRSLRKRRAHCFFQRAHLSALTLAALATGFYPDGSAPEPGFPRRPRNRCFSRFANQRKKDAAVKHAPCGPVLVPVDRGPEAAREREGRTPARGHRISLSSIRRHRLTSLNNQRDGRRYLHRRGEVKGVSILVVESKHFAARVFVQRRGTPMILWRHCVRHGWTCPSHPRLFACLRIKTWIARNKCGHDRPLQASRHCERSEAIQRVVWVERSEPHRAMLRFK